MIGLLARTSEKTMTRKTLSPALALAACASLLAGCAQVPPNAGENPADPWEGFNRNVHAFNSTLDRAVAKPVAEAYVEWTPELVRKGVSNAVDNLGEPSNALNNTLQGKVDKGIGSLFRFLVKSALRPRPRTSARRSASGVWGRAPIWNFRFSDPRPCAT